MSPSHIMAPMTTGAEWSDDTIVDRWSRLGIEPHTFELGANGTLQSHLHGGARAGDTVIEALAPFERAQLALKGEIPGVRKASW